MRYESTQNNAFVEKTFLLDIYPETDYSHPAQLTTCVPDIFPATLGNRAGVTLIDGDVATNNFMICGSVKTLTYHPNDATYDHAFVQILNRNVMLDYQLVFESLMGSVMQGCQFGNAGSIFLGINARLTSSVSNFEQIYIYKYLMANAKLVVAKTIKAKGGIARLRTMKVDLSLGD